VKQPPNSEIADSAATIPAPSTFFKFIGIFECSTMGPGEYRHVLNPDRNRPRCGDRLAFVMGGGAHTVLSRPTLRVLQECICITPAVACGVARVRGLSVEIHRSVFIEIIITNAVTVMPTD